MSDNEKQKKRKAIPLDTKVKIARFLNNGGSIRGATKEFCVSKGTVQGVAKNKDALLSAEKQNLNLKLTRLSSSNVVNNLLWRFFEISRSRGFPISGPIRYLFTQPSYKVHPCQRVHLAHFKGAFGVYFMSRFYCTCVLYDTKRHFAMVRHIFLGRLEPGNIDKTRLFSSSSRRELSRSRQNKPPKLSAETLTFDKKYTLPTFIHRPDPTCTRDGVDHAAPSDRPPILLVSGWTGIASDWGAMPSMIANRLGRDVITYDARGVGDSFPTLRDNDENNHDGAMEFIQGGGRLCARLDELSLELMASDALCVAKAAESKRQRRVDDGSAKGGQPSDEQPQSFCVAGASMGGIVAQILAGAARGRVRLPCGRGEGSQSFRLTSMALVCTSSRGPSSPTARRFLDSFESWCPRGDAAANERCADQFFGLGLGEAFLRRPGRARLRRRLTEGYVASRAMSVNACGAGVGAQKEAILRFERGRGETDGFLPEVGRTVPSLVVHGKDDVIFPLESAFIMKELLGDESELELIEECGHLCWITHGLELVDVLSDFYIKSPLFLRDSST